MAATYDPGKVVADFFGIISGYADGSFIKATRNADTFSTTVGADGTVVRTRNRNATGRVTFTLLQSSPSNDILGGIAILDELTGAGVGPLIIKDLNGSAICVAAKAWLVKPADMDFSKEVGNREWIVECERLDIQGGAITA